MGTVELFPKVRVDDRKSLTWGGKLLFPGFPPRLPFHSFWTCPPSNPNVQYAHLSQKEGISWKRSATAHIINSIFTLESEANPGSDTYQAKNYLRKSVPYLSPTLGTQPLLRK